MTLKSPVINSCTIKYNIQKLYILPTLLSYVFCILEQTAIISIYGTI